MYMLIVLNHTGSFILLIYLLLIAIRINMSYGATVGASAANSNLIEFKK